MGNLSTILTWHCVDPVDAKERLRNHVVFVSQDNRNPFVDNPTWVGDIWGSRCAALYLPRVP